MAKFKFEIEQTRTFEVIIDAESDEAAEKIFDDYITDDFGEPTSAVMHYTIVETT